MQWVALDVETKSRVSLKRQGLDNYVRCPDFACIVAATVSLSTGEIQVSDDEKSIRAHLEPLIKSSTTQFIAHNALFEYVVVRALAQRWGIDPPALSRFHCTAAMGGAMGLPNRLGSLAALMLGDTKLEQGKDLINIFSIPDKKGLFGTRDTHPEEWAIFVEYCIKDARLCAQIWELLPKLTSDTRRYWLSVARMNLRGFTLDLPIIQRVLGDIDMIKADANATTKALTGDAVQKTTQGKKLLEWLSHKGYLSNTINAEQVEAWLQEPDIPDDVRDILLARMKASKSTFGKYAAFKRYASPDGRNRHGYWFYGAHTGRLSGKGSQPQNVAYDKKGLFEESPSQILHLYRNDLLPEDYDKSEALVAMTRAVIMARPGWRFYIVDYASIEARIVVWLADQLDALSLYRQGKDLYIPMTARILGIPVELVTKQQRNKFGKPTVLGGGFGLGVDTFAKKNNLSREHASACIKAYRQANPKVVEYWGKLEAQFKHCLRTGRPTKAGKVRFRYVTIGVVNFVVCRPPGGRDIWYRNPSIDKRGDLHFERTGVSGTYETKLWGAAILENVAQNIAGFVLTWGMFNVEEMGALPCLQIHDELVCEVLPGTNPSVLDSGMLAVPGVDGLPLAVESKIEERYGK